MVDAIACVDVEGEAGSVGCELATRRRTKGVVDAISRLDELEAVHGGCNLSHRCGGGSTWLMKTLPSMRRRQGVVDAISRVEVEEEVGRG